MFVFKVITTVSKQRLDTRLKRPIRLSVDGLRLFSFGILSLR